MCCVIPPDSEDAISVFLILSSREVFPWSTWPRNVTMGALSFKSSSLSTVSSSENSSSSSFACFSSISTPYSIPIISMSSPSKAWFIVAKILWPISNFDIISPAFTPKAADTSLTVAGNSIVTFSSFSVGCTETFSLDTTSFVRLSNLLGLFCCETFVTSFHLPLINSSLAFCFQSGIRLRAVDSVSLGTTLT